jgi:hypothetical protein
MRLPDDGEMGLVRFDGKEYLLVGVLMLRQAESSGVKVPFNMFHSVFLVFRNTEMLNGRTHTPNRIRV